MSKIPVMLRIRSIQKYQDQDPDVIDLTTEGTLEQQKDTWEVAYAESDMTGMEGVTTVFRVTPRGISLLRTGKLQSRMIFREGHRHESLYQMEMGAFMIGVQTTRICYDITEAGGTVELAYDIDIEQTTGGTVEYHLDIHTI